MSARSRAYPWYLKHPARASRHARERRLLDAYYFTWTDDEDESGLLDPMQWLVMDKEPEFHQYIPKQGWFRHTTTGSSWFVPLDYNGYGFVGPHRQLLDRQESESVDPVPWAADWKRFHDKLVDHFCRCSIFLSDAGCSYNDVPLLR